MKLNDQTNAAAQYKITMDLYDKHGLQLKTSDVSVPAEAAFRLGEFKAADLTPLVLKGKQKDRDKINNMQETDQQKIGEVLTRGVEKIYPNREELEKFLESGKKIRLYGGIDPTGKLHLGHMAVLRKLRQFQNLGHEIIVLIGDFTATIGDPTDKLAARKPLDREQVLDNAKDYKKQIGKILDFKKSNIRFLQNEQWTNKLKPVDLLKIASYFTVARLLERDMFQKRIQENKDIQLLIIHCMLPLGMMIYQN